MKDGKPQSHYGQNQEDTLFLHMTKQLTTINLQLKLSRFSDHQVNKCSLLQEYSYVGI